jgi:chromosome partitioning protein
MSSHVMHSLAVVNQKGGVGKTTVSTHLAVAAVRLALVTFVLDIDPQPNATLWADERENARQDAAKKARLATSTEPAVLPAQIERLPIFIKQARAGGADLLIYDTPPNAERVGTEAVRYADAILIPLPPKPLELKALPTTLAIARASRKPFFVVLNDAPVQGNEVQETVDSLKQAGIEIAPVVLHTRKAFYSHMQIGATAMDFDPQGKAANETRALMLWLCEHMGILRRDVKKYTNIQINEKVSA